jgi:hypothetical protein
MKGLLGFYFKYRWPMLLACSLFGGTFIFVFLIRGGLQQLLMLVLTFIYAQFVERLGIKRPDEEYIPRVALPFSKATFILFVVIKTIVYYLLCAAFAALWFAVLWGFKHSAVIHLEYLPFVLLFLSALSSITLIIDCLSSFKYGIFAAFLFCLLTCCFVEPIGPALEKLDASGSFLALSRGVSAYLSGTAIPLQLTIGIAFALIAASTLFGMAYAKRIRF